MIAGAMLSFSIAAAADPPSRVARMGYLSGAVSLSPAGENEWVQAAINRPLTTGDRVWTDAGARAEVQIGGAMIRMNAGTGLAILNLDDSIAQLQLSQGSLNVRVRRLAPNQAFEIDTPNLALTFRQPGAAQALQDTHLDADEVGVEHTDKEVGRWAGWVSGPRMLKIVRTPSSLRTGAACFIAGWWLGANIKAMPVSSMQAAPHRP